jgi:hypothetical protein
MLVVTDQRTVSLSEAFSRQAMPFPPSLGAQRSVLLNDKETGTTAASTRFERGAARVASFSSPSEAGSSPDCVVAPTGPAGTVVPTSARRSSDYQRDGIASCPRLWRSWPRSVGSPLR